LQRYLITQAHVNQVDILRESNGLGIGPDDPLANLLPLTNDEYSMRQFLYPTVVTEPGMLTLFGLGALMAIGRRRPRS